MAGSQYAGGGGRMKVAEARFSRYRQSNPEPRSQAFLAGLLHGIAIETGELPRGGNPSPFSPGQAENDAFALGLLTGVFIDFGGEP